MSSAAAPSATVLRRRSLMTSPPRARCGRSRGSRAGSPSRCPRAARPHSHGRSRPAGRLPGEPAREDRRAQLCAAGVSRQIAPDPGERAKRDNDRDRRSPHHLHGILEGRSASRSGRHGALPRARATSRQARRRQQMERRTRRTAALLLLLAAGLLPAACGKSDRTSTVAASPAAPPGGAQSEGAGTPQPGARPWTRAQAQAFARAVNLTAADVPGFTVVPPSRLGATPAERRLQAETARCLGGSGTVTGAGSSAGLAEVSSPHFQREAGARSASVSSEVNVSRTSALASRELAEIRSARTRACLTRYMEQVLGRRAGGGVSSAVSVVGGNPPAAGTTGGFGWRITVALAVRGARIPVYLDILGFVYGPAEVSMFSSGLPEPFPAAAEEHLYSLLLKRATAQKL